MSPEPLPSEPTDELLPRSNWRMVLIFGSSFIILGIICVIVLYAVVYAMKLDPQTLLQSNHASQVYLGGLPSHLA